VFEENIWTSETGKTGKLKKIV